MTLTEDKPPIEAPTLSKLELAAIVTFIVSNVVVPIVVGELYPFTIAPMFRDSPKVYCDYKAWDSQGREISLSQVGLERVYDGNPPGMGVGIRPPETLNEFGVAPSVQEVSRWVRSRLPPGESFVELEQRVIGPIDDQRVGVVRTERFRVTRDE